MTTREGLERAAEICEQDLVNRPDDPVANHFDGGLRHAAKAIRAEVAKLPEDEMVMPTQGEILLACGELTAGELRAVKAALGWFIRKHNTVTAQPSVGGETPITDAHLAHLNLPDGRKIGLPDVTVALLRKLELAGAFRAAKSGERAVAYAMASMLRHAPTLGEAAAEEAARLLEDYAATLAPQGGKEWE